MTGALQPWLDRWGLVPDGAPVRTATSWLAPVLWQGRAAMLKLALVEEERAGNALMVWRAGDGAAEVLAHDGPALLMARGARPLLELFRDGCVGEGVAALAGALARLHRPRADRPEVVSLERRCAGLFAATGAPFGRAAAMARRLLDAPREVVILHGDAHPANWLDFGGTWLAIDPKGVEGERTFDYTHAFVTPDLPGDPARLDRLLRLIADAGGLDRSRLRRWIAVSAALSAAWSIEDDENPRHALTVADWALSGL